MTAPVDRRRPSRQGVVLTAAGTAAIVCLVGWPRPTTYAAGLIVAAVALLVGLRLLAAERRQTVPPADPGRADHPDASGASPEITRTRPDTTDPDPTEQHGPDPDDLRNRIATAIRHKIPPGTGLPGSMITPTGDPDAPSFGLTEYALADTVLAVVQPELAAVRQRLNRVLAVPLRGARPGLAQEIHAAANTAVGTDPYDRPARAVRDFARHLEHWLPTTSSQLGHVTGTCPTCGRGGAR